MAKQKQPAADPTLLAASTWNAIVEGWELQNQREIARANAPQTINMSKLRMKPSGGSYGAGSSVPRDPTTGVPIP